MQYLSRYIENKILSHLVPGKVIVLLGARRVGKTVLLKRIMDQFNKEKIFLNADDYRTEAILAHKSAEEYRSLIGNNDLLLIDEAQKIQDIGRILKIMVDEIPQLRIMVTGSSAFDLTNKLGEPLTGRKSTFYLYPFAQCELIQTENILNTRALFENRLIYGSYPELVFLKDNEEKVNYLNDLVSSYLLKDILELDSIKSSSKTRNRSMKAGASSSKALNLPASIIRPGKNLKAQYIRLNSRSLT